MAPATAAAIRAAREGAPAPRAPFAWTTTFQGTSFWCCPATTATTSPASASVGAGRGWKWCFGKGVGWCGIHAVRLLADATAISMPSVPHPTGNSDCDCPAGLGNRRPVCPVCKADARASSINADVEEGRSGSSIRGQRPETFLLRMGASWFAVRRHFSRNSRAGSERAHRERRVAAAAAAHDEAGTRQLLLGGSRASTPIPTNSAPHHAETETPATLANFPHLFPAR